MALKILCTNPLEHASALKELFRSTDAPWFPEFFDRAYPSAVESGAKSWIGIDSNGQLVLHIARFRHRFALGERTVTAGQLANLMVAKSHRTFLPAVTLMRRVVSDSKACGDVDFLYGDPLPAAATVLKAAGFSTVGTLGRFAFPLGSQRWYADLLVRLYQKAVRIRGLRDRLSAVQHPAERFDSQAFERPVGFAGALQPFRPPELLHQRLAGYPTARDVWFTLHRNSRSSEPSAAILVRGFEDGIAKVISLSREPSTSVSSVIPPVASALRKAGYKRLWASAMLETQLASAWRRAGFIRRHDAFPILACAVTELGTDALRTAAANWDLMDLDCDRGESLAG